MVATRMRDYQRTPAMEAEEREDTYGTYRPTTLRAHRPPTADISVSRADQQAPWSADAQADEGADEQETDELLTDEEANDELRATNRGRAIREVSSHASRRRGTLSPASSTQEPHRSAHWLLPAGLTVICLIALYTLAFFVVSGWITVSNTFTYGPTHTYQADARFGSQVEHILATNVHGTIYVAILEPQPDGSVKTSLYTGPKLNAETWGNLDAIVVTVSVESMRARTSAASLPVLTVHLVGNPQYDRLLFARPEMDFALVPDGKGSYRVQVSA